MLGLGLGLRFRLRGGGVLGWLGLGLLLWLGLGLLRGGLGCGQLLQQLCCLHLLQGRRSF